MNELEMVELRHKKRLEKEFSKQDDKKISKIFTKILLSIILVLSCTIYVKLSSENLEFFKTHVLENNLTFTKINNWYHEVFGSFLPSVKEPDTQTVAGETNTLVKEKYLDGYKISTKKGNSILSLASGLYVFIGEKGGYGNVLIIQGVNGVDIWYGNLENTNLKLYDYIETNTVLGTAKEDYYYLAFVKDGNFISYEEYQNQM